MLTELQRQRVPVAAAYRAEARAASPRSSHAANPASVPCHISPCTSVWTAGTLPSRPAW